MLNMWLHMRKNHGWYDINKTFSQDTYLCFSATASNMLHWWMDQNSDYIDKYLMMYPDLPKREEIKVFADNSPKGQHDSNIYNRFVDQFSNRREGYWPDNIFRINLLMDINPKRMGERMIRDGMDKI